MAPIDESVELPDKLFYKIGEVSRIVGAEPHVLRYWEKEFAFIRPRKSRGGQRLYRRADVLALARIKTLLRNEGFTIAGARKKIALERKESKPLPLDERPQSDPPGSESNDETTLRLMDEVERLKGDCQRLRESRSALKQELASSQDALRHIRNEITTLLTTIAELKTRRKI